MTFSICFNCGSNKDLPLDKCTVCGSIPDNIDTKSLSIALSEHLSSKEDLYSYSNQIQNREHPSIAEDILIKARSALSDPQLIAMLGSNASAEINSGENNKQETPTKHQRPIINKYKKTITTELHKNPFYILGVSISDNRRSIVSIAEEKSLEIDHDICQKARSDLTNPRTRLSAEMKWLPGVSPEKASQLIQHVHSVPFEIIHNAHLPELATLNLLSSRIETIDHSEKLDDLMAAIMDFSGISEWIDMDDILSLINSDRKSSGFPEISSIDQIEAEFTELKRHYRNVMKNALNGLDPNDLVHLMTEILEDVTENGEEHAPELIYQLIDSYQLESKPFLEQEGKNIEKLISSIREHAESGEEAITHLIDKLITVTRNWDRVAQPIQLSDKSRGLDHEESNEVAYSIRQLGIDLFNEFGLLDQSKRITDLLQELFSELPELIERVEEDAEALEDLFESQRNMKEQYNQWAEEITYSTEWGTIFKKRLSISPDGVSWKDKTYPLKDITKVRWGGIKQSVNGISTGTTYTIAFGNNYSMSEVQVDKDFIYTKFIDKLWRAVGFRLLTDMLENLSNGESLRFGDAVVHDDGITLIKHKFIAANESVKLGWGQVQVWSASGDFLIGSVEDKKTYSSMSYINDSNVHILEQAIRMKFKKGGTHLLSGLLADN